MKPKNVEDYIAQAPKEFQSKLKEIRSAIKEAVPEAEELISYGMPYYRYKGRLIYFGYAKNHVALYGAIGSLIQQHKSELKGYETSKGTIRFPLDEKLPIALIKKLVKAQVRANEAKKKK